MSYESEVNSMSIRQVDVDHKIGLAFDYAFGRESFVRESVDFIWTHWGQASEEARQYILGVLGEAMKAYELENLENTLILTFTNDHVSYKGCLGNSTTAGIWRGFYRLVGDSSPPHQAPPETKSNNSHLPVV